MGDTNVRIKLTADGTQARQEIKLIDREIQKIVSSQNTSSIRNQSQKSSSETQSQQAHTANKDSEELTRQESRDKVTERASKELTIIRKELQKINENSGGSGSHTPPSSSGGGTGSGTGNIPTPQNNNDTNSGKLGDVLGKLATAAVALKAASAAFSYIKQGAAESRAGEALAYQTYGSTLMYTDYYQAKKDSYEIGLPYGYDYQTVMSASDANMSKAGYTTVDNYTNDMESILKTSKGWGIDANTLANTSGYMTSIGVTESGSQDKFMKMFSQSIVDAKMTGREDEQLQVLEEIAENLAQVNTTVSDNAIGNQLNMYNALVAQNENLKGTRGSTLLGDMSSIARSGDISLDILAGMNTKYTGKEGYIELRRLSEENPAEYWKQVAQGMVDYGFDRNDAIYKLSKSSNLSISQIEATWDSIQNMDNYDYSNTTAGENALDARIQNYNSSDVATNEQYEINKQYAKEAVGDTFWNTIANPFKKLFSGMPAWAQSTVGVSSAVVPTVLGGIGLNKAFNWTKGKFTGAASGGWWSNLFKKGSQSVDDVVNAAANGADGILGASSVADDVVRATGNSVDDIISGVGKSTGALSKAGKALGAAGTVIEVVTSGYDAYEAHERGDNREMSQEIGGGVGSIAGGWGGEFAGAGAGAAIGSIVPGVGTAIGGVVGGIVGGIGGGIGGNKLGEIAGESIYDIASGGDKYNFSNADKKQIREYYDEVSRLYEEEGNNAAQKFVKEYVSPYLNSLGVSTSITDDYKWDVGKSDFMKDIEDGRFGSLEYHDEEVERTRVSSDGVDNLTNGQKKQIQEYYDEVSRLYEEEGNNAAQKYTTDTIAPYLMELGYSKNFTDKYNHDAGKPDFMKDVEKGSFGDLSMGDTIVPSDNRYVSNMLAETSTLENTSALEENTEALNNLAESLGISAINTSDITKSGEATNDREDALSNSKVQGSQAGFWSRLFGTSHAVGNDYVPHDNYLASLHKGEMVLTEAEATDYRQGKVLSSNGGSGQISGSIDINVNLSGGVAGMSTNAEKQIIDAIKAQLSSSNLQEILANGFKRMQNC